MSLLELWWNAKIPASVRHHSCETWHLHFFSALVDFPKVSGFPIFWGEKTMETLRPLRFFKAPLVSRGCAPLALIWPWNSSGMRKRGLGPWVGARPEVRSAASSHSRSKMDPPKKWGRFSCWIWMDMGFLELHVKVAGGFSVLNMMTFSSA